MIPAVFLAWLNEEIICCVYAFHQYSERYMYIIMHRLEWWTLYVLTRKVFWCYLEAASEINIKTTIVWVLKHFVARVHVWFYFLHDITKPQMSIKTAICTHRPPHSLGLRSADDVTIDFWWRNKCITQLTNCVARKWKAISNSINM